MSVTEKLIAQGNNQSNQVNKDININVDDIMDILNM